MLHTTRTTQVIGKRIREARRKREWTQEQLAEKVGISRGFLSLIEIGKPASVDTLEEIAKTLRISLKDLFP